MDWMQVNIRVKTLVGLGLTPWGVARILDWVIISILKERGE